MHRGEPPIRASLCRFNVRGVEQWTELSMESAKERKRGEKDCHPTRKKSNNSYL